MVIEKASQKDLIGLLTLYTYLHGNAMPPLDEKLEKLWQNILADTNHHIVIGLHEKAIISSCVLMIIPNLTHNQRPYALIENVITHPDYRGNGYASRLLDCAKGIAVEKGCYKIMLMTGSKQESTLRFYQRAGYNHTDKIAFIQWLD